MESRGFDSAPLNTLWYADDDGWAANGLEDLDHMLPKRSSRTDSTRHQAAAPDSDGSALEVNGLLADP